MNDSNIILNVNGIEVIYNHVILVLKGVSLQVPERGIVALLGGNGAGKTTTLRAISNLLQGERGEVTRPDVNFTRRGQGRRVTTDPCPTRRTRRRRSRPLRLPGPRTGQTSRRRWRRGH